MSEEEKVYATLDEWFADHPEDEDSFYDDLANMDDDYELPEDYFVGVV